MSQRNKPRSAAMGRAQSNAELDRTVGGGAATQAVLPPKLPIEVSPTQLAKLAVIKGIISSGNNNVINARTVEGAAMVRMLVGVAEQATHTGSVHPTTLLSAVPVPILTETFAVGDTDDDGTLATSEMLSLSQLVGDFGLMPVESTQSKKVQQPENAEGSAIVHRQIYSCPFPLSVVSGRIASTGGATAVEGSGSSVDVETTREVFGEVGGQPPSWQHYYPNSSSSQHSPSSPTTRMMPMTLPSSGSDKKGGGKKASVVASGGGASPSSKSTNKKGSKPDGSDFTAGGGNKAVSSPSSSLAASSLLGTLGGLLSGRNLATLSQQEIDTAITEATSTWLTTRVVNAIIASSPPPVTDANGGGGYGNSALGHDPSSSFRDAKRMDAANKPPPSSASPPVAPPSPSDNAALDHEMTSAVSADASRLSFFLSCAVAECSLTCGALFANETSAIASLSRLFAPPSMFLGAQRPLRNIRGVTPRMPTPIVTYEIPVLVVPPQRKGSVAAAVPATPNANGGGYLLTCSPHSHNGACSSVGECVQAITDLDRSIRRRCHLVPDRHFRSCFPPWGAYEPDVCDGRTLDQSIRLALSDVSSVLSQVNLVPHPGSGVHLYPQDYHNTQQHAAIPKQPLKGIDTAKSHFGRREVIREQVLSSLIAAQKATTTDLDVAIVDPMSMMAVPPPNGVMITEGSPPPATFAFFSTLSELVHDIAVMKREGIAVVLDMRRILMELPMSPQSRVECLSASSTPSNNNDSDSSPLANGTGGGSYACADAPPSELFWIHFAAWCDVDALLLLPPKGSHSTRAYNELLRCEASISESNNGYCQINTLLED